MKKVLFIVTGHHQLGERSRATGLYLSEFAHPYQQFTQAGGYDLEVASPRGGSAPIDPKSLTEELVLFTHHVHNTIAFSDVLLEVYDVYFIVGGHGALWDLPGNRELQYILSTAYVQGKVIAAVGHGAAALVQLNDQQGCALIQGKRVTSFTNSEETAIGLTHIVPLSSEDRLKNAGAAYSCGPIWQSYVVVDGHLVTGQNPASARGVGEAVINILSRNKIPA